MQLLNFVPGAAGGSRQWKGDLAAGSHSADRNGPHLVTSDFEAWVSSRRMTGELETP